MNEISSTTRKVLELSMLSGVGPVSLRKAAQLFSPGTSDMAGIGEAVPAIGKARAVLGAWDAAVKLAQEQIELAERYGARILSPVDKDYPSLLAGTKDDPFLLYVLGKLAPSPEKSVAIIGTREPTPHGVVITTRITQYFVKKGWSVVSGLALGCDAIAHRSAIEANGHTVAVLAHGLQTIAPAKHRRLADEILNAGGALISQYPIGRDAIPQQFAQRDKTQAGMVQGVVMVQSDLKGGSLHASRAAIDYGRWLAVPYPTERDLALRESKIQANLILADGTQQEKADLLHPKDVVNLGNILVLRGREDYALCTEIG